MTEPTCRLDVFKLLNNADFIYRPDTNTWSHHDGRPFTDAEQAMAHDATDVELETLSSTRKIGLDHGLGDPAHALRILMYRYSIKLPNGTTDEDIVAAMTDKDRTEYQRLRTLIRTGIRPEVVTLLLDADLPAYLDTNTWTHHDGQPFTKQEKSLACSCTLKEMEAVLAQIQLELDFKQEREADAPRAFCALMDKYFGDVPDGTLIHDPASRMTEEDRIEYLRLRDILGPEMSIITDRDKD
ncbi:hypothetical protein AB0F92_15915 [Kitasatospora aureofaciens]|uniref:hypothetical protein n=1 Tax=Kitasatospora aureofaciens TaxID=1894 RepID=UPI00092C0C31|nr:hypothetical protein BOQ63_025920 [Streptomyces viridifaciens]